MGPPIGQTYTSQIIRGTSVALGRWISNCLNTNPCSLISKNRRIHEFVVLGENWRAGGNAGGPDNDGNVRKTHCVLARAEVRYKDLEVPIVSVSNKLFEIQSNLTFLRLLLTYLHLESKLFKRSHVRSLRCSSFDAISWQ